MRTLILHDKLSEKGGSDRYVLSLLDALYNKAKTFLITAHDDQSLIPSERNTLTDHLCIKGLDNKGISERGLKSVIQNLNHQISTFNPDLIHIQNILDPDLLTFARKQRPCVITIHDHRVFCPGQGKIKPNDVQCDSPLGEDCKFCFRDKDYGSRMIELTIKRLEAVKQMDQIIVLSAYMADELNKCGIDKHQINIVPAYPHIGNEAQPFYEKPYHFLAGRLVRRKGIRIAMDAIEKTNNDIPLIIAGTGQMEGEIIKRAEASSGKIKYVGWLNRSEGEMTIESLITGALSVWLPSIWVEPFGLVGLEALALGKPVIASNCGGIREYVLDGQTGILVRPGKSNALAKAADKLADNPDLAERMGKNGASLVREKFSKKQFVDGILDVYRKMTR